MTMTQTAPKKSNRWALHVLHALYYVLMIAFLVFYMLPFWGTVVTSFKTKVDVGTSSALALPKEWTMEAYSEAMVSLVNLESFPEADDWSEEENWWEATKENFEIVTDLLFEEGVPLLNSLIITVGGAAGSLILGSLCAYALTKFPFKGSKLFFVLLVAATYLPFQAILIPLTRTIGALGLYENVLGLILVHSVFGTPMCTVMMRGYYQDVPNALINQAKIDGNGPWAIYAKIVVPNTKIANITVFVFQCTSIWNEMLFALVLGGYSAKPATIALNEMLGTMGGDYNVLMAGSMILALPVLILYIFMGKFLIRGYMAGAVTAS